MRSRWTLVLIAVTTLCGLIALALPAAQTDSADEAAIRALIGKINLAWKSDNGQEIMREVISDKSFTFAIPRPQKPSEALVINKAAFCSSLADILRNHRPIKHAHTVKSITVVGPLAYEVGITDQVDANGVARSERIMLFFAKEDVGWRLISWAPAENVEKALAEFKAETAK